MSLGKQRGLNRRFPKPPNCGLSLLCLQRLGVDSLVEVGLGATLTSLARRTGPALRRWNVASPTVARELLTSGVPDGRLWGTYLAAYQNPIQIFVRRKE